MLRWANLSLRLTLKDAIHHVPLTENLVINVGRTSTFGAGLPLPGDVSRVHVQVWREGDIVYVKNMSLNGTLRSGLYLGIKQTTMNVGDQLELSASGTCSLSLHVEKCLPATESNSSGHIENKENVILVPSITSTITDLKNNPPKRPHSDIEASGEVVMGQAHTDEMRLPIKFLTGPLPKSTDNGSKTVPSIPSTLPDLNITAAAFAPPAFSCGGAFATPAPAAASPAFSFGGASVAPTATRSLFGEVAPASPAPSNGAFGGGLASLAEHLHISFDLLHINLTQIWFPCF